MPLVDYPRSGMANSSEFTSSGIPYVKNTSAPTTEPDQINFNFVSKEMTIKNDENVGGGDIVFGFSRNGTKNGPDRFKLRPGESITMDVKVKELFIMSVGATANYSLHVSLTMIPERFMVTLTGSAPLNWDGVG
jgi:hypothetical protein